MTTDPSAITFPPPPPVELTLQPGLERYLHTTGKEFVWRFHGHDVKTDKPFGPVFFSDREKSRWDFIGTSTLPHSSGVFCVGRSFTGSLLEYFSKGWPSLLDSNDPKLGLLAKRRVITYHEHTHVYVTRIQLHSGLRLLDLTKIGAFTSIGYGIDAWLTSTKEYQFTRPWAEWFFRCVEIDGLVYSSRPGGAQARNYVLFNRPGLQPKLEKALGKTRQLGQWSKPFAKAQKELNILALQRPTDVGHSQH